MDTINFSFSRQFCLINGCTIILSSPLPAISEDVTIHGVGNWTPTISGAFTYRIFDLQAVFVNLSNMYLIRGSAVGSSTAGYGGAINTSSSGTTLQVTNVGFVVSTTGLEEPAAHGFRGAMDDPCLRIYALNLRSV